MATRNGSHREDKKRRISRLLSSLGSFIFKYFDSRRQKSRSREDNLWSVKVSRAVSSSLLLPTIWYFGERNWTFSTFISCFARNDIIPWIWNILLCFLLGKNGIKVPKNWIHISFLFCWKKSLKMYANEMWPKGSSSCPLRALKYCERTDRC